MSARHTSTPKGRFVLRADAIRPYGLSGEAATFHPTALFRHARADSIRPYRACADLPQ